MYLRFHCLSDSVIWLSDFTLEDIGEEGEGVVHICHCANCGAEIQHIVRSSEEVCK